MFSADDLVQNAYDAEDGVAKQKLHDGRSVLVCDHGETILLQDFRPSTARWSSDHIDFEQLRLLISETEEKQFDAKWGAQ